MRRVLVVDHEEGVREAVYEFLNRFGFDVKCVATAEDARRCLSAFEPDLVLLDPTLPGESGEDFCRDICRTDSVPVIFLSEPSDGRDRLTSELADDCLTRPFMFSELLARVRAALRRRMSSSERSERPNLSDPADLLEPLDPAASLAEGTIEYGPICIDLTRPAVVVGEEVVGLTIGEFKVLKKLMTRPRRVHRREQLFKLSSGERIRMSGIRRLRAKLVDAAGFDPIETVRGVGYRMRPLTDETCDDIGRCDHRTGAD